MKLRRISKSIGRLDLADPRRFHRSRHHRHDLGAVLDVHDRLVFGLTRRRRARANVPRVKLALARRNWLTMRHVSRTRCTVTNARNAVSDYSGDCVVADKKAVSLVRRCDAATFRIPFQINWIITLVVIASVLFSQFAGSAAGRHVLSSDGRKHHNGRCSGRRSIEPRSILPALTTDKEPPAITPRDVLLRMEAAAVLRDHLLTALGRVLLLCLDDNARVPFERIRDTVRTRQVAAYDFLQILPELRNKTPLQQLYKLLQMLERIGSRFVSEYASLCIDVFTDIDLKRVWLPDMLTGVDHATMESISWDQRRVHEVPSSLEKAVDFLLRAARNDNALVNLHTASAILLNHPAFDFTDPEVPGAVRFVAQRMKELSRPGDLLLDYMEPNLENGEDFLRAVLERMEVNESMPDAIREAISLLLQNLGEKSYPSVLGWRTQPRKLLIIANDRYPANVSIVAKYLADRLNDSHIRDLDIAFYEETAEHALMQVLSRLRRKSDQQHLRKPLSLIIPFVSQKLMSDTTHEYSAPISYHEVSGYLDSFDTPCLQHNISDSMRTLRVHLSEDLPWTYAFGDRRLSDDPWELTLTSLIRLRNMPMSEQRAVAIDNFVYRSRASAVTGRRASLYEHGVVFQRDDSANVEVDLFSLLMRVPNVFNSEDFAPMLNFLSKPDILDILGHGFNKFEHETPRSLLLAMLRKALTLSVVKSDEVLSSALKNARDYLEEPLLVNLYTTEDLQQLLNYLLDIDSDPRYLPLKILFKKQKLLTYLSPTFNLSGVSTPMETLVLILQTVSLKATQPELAEALSFALNSFDGPPLPARIFDRGDFVYLVKQLLSRDKPLRNEILNSSVYKSVDRWNISVSGTPESVLARIVSYPVEHIANDSHLAYVVKRAESIMRDRNKIDILKERTLRSMLEYISGSTYVKPVHLLLRKANLMSLVPQLNAGSLESGVARDSLIGLLKALTESPAIRAERLLLRRIRAALSSLDGVQLHDRQPPVLAYLSSLLRDPSNGDYTPLWSEMNASLRNATVPFKERRVWLMQYLRRVVEKKENVTESLRKAARIALTEIAHEEDTDEEARAAKTRIGKAVSTLPTGPVAEPLRKLFTPDWVYGILPEEIRNSEFTETEELLLTILRHVKKRVDVAGNLALSRLIAKVEMNVGGWKTNVEPLKRAVGAVKATAYDPVRNFLTAAVLSKLKASVPVRGSAKESLLEVLRLLLSHPVIQKNDMVTGLLSAVRQDVASFGVDIDLLNVLDDAGVAYASSLAPVRLFLHERDVNDKFGRKILAIASPEKRYRVLLKFLQYQRQMDNDTRFQDALSTLKNIKPVTVTAPSTLVSDLSDIANGIPHRVRQKYKSIDYLFNNNNTLSSLTHDDEIVESENPLITLLYKMTNLPEIRENYTVVNTLNNMLAEMKRLNVRPGVTGYLLKPLLRELRHVQQINVDFVDRILEPEMLSYLNLDEYFILPDDETEILRTVVDYLLDNGPAYVDKNMLKHLQSLKRALMLTLGSDATSDELTANDWKEMLRLVPHEKDFAPIKIFLQSEAILEYTHGNINWRSISTPAKKLLHLLSLIMNGGMENKNVYRSAKRLHASLEERFDFVTEANVRSMQRTLASLKLRYDLVPLKIFLNHDSMIRYLPADFKYDKYSSPIHSLVAVLDQLLQVSSLRRRTVLYKTMTYVRRSLLDQAQSRRSLSAPSSKPLSGEDLKFVSLLDTASTPKLREFLTSPTLADLLPDSFSFHGRPTFKTKAEHLLRQLLKVNSDVKSELEAQLRKVETYPDVPNITTESLAPIQQMIPVKGIPYVSLVRKYLRASVLIKLLPGTFDMKKMPNSRAALREILLTLNVTLGAARSDKMKIAIDALVEELTNASPAIILKEAAVDNDDVKSIVNEIPFKRYKQIEKLQPEMSVEKVIAALPLNFRLDGYKTKKLRLSAVMDELSRSKSFEPSMDSINFVRRFVSEMPDMPKVNDTEIEKLLWQLPLRASYVKHLIENCRMSVLATHLPVYFDLNSIETRKGKIAEILRYCKLATRGDVGTKQTLVNAEELVKKLPDFDVTREHVEVLIKTIPCTHFTMIQPLLRYLSKVNAASLLTWDFDVYRASTFKGRILDLLAALRNAKELQNDKMFAALDTLERNAKLMLNKINVTQQSIDILNKTEGITGDSYKNYRELVIKPEILAKILPPNCNFTLQNTSHANHEWSLLIYYSTLFLRDVRVNGPVKNAFKATADFFRASGISDLVRTIKEGLEQQPYKQLVPMRLYTLGHVSTFTEPIKDAYRGYLHGPASSLMRVALREFIRRPEILRSKSLINDMEVFLRDYAIARHRDDRPSDYEMREAVRQIPSDEEYDDLRLLMQCHDIRLPISQKVIPEDGTPKQLLLSMLELAGSTPVDEKIRHSIEQIKPTLKSSVRAEEAEFLLRQMRDYRYHASRVSPVRSHLAKEGLSKILGDYRAKYPTVKERLIAISDTLAAARNLSHELHEASQYLKQVVHNERKIQHVVPRTIDDINVHTLFFALPKTRDERIIRGIIRFFSTPNLLRKLHLPRSPFDYATKGRLLQVVMDLGQEMHSVRQDPLQQEALEYLRDKIAKTGAGAQPIELKKYSRNSNARVDMYGVMRAIDYSRANETSAVQVAMFFESKYDNLIHAVGFDHLAYATRGAYLRALLGHLVNVSQVPDDAKQQMNALIPVIKTDGPGDEAVDLNDDVTPDMRIFEDVNLRSHKPSTRSYEVITESPRANRETGESLKTAVRDTLEAIASTDRFEDAHLEHANEVQRRRSLDSKRKDEHRAKSRDALDDFDWIDKYRKTASKNKYAGSESGKRKVKSSRRSHVDDVEVNDSDATERRTVAPLPPSARQPSRKTHRSRGKHRQSKTRRLFIRPDSTDIEFDEAGNGDALDFRMFRDALLKEEESLSLTKELMAEKRKAETAKRDEFDDERAGREAKTKRERKREKRFGAK